MSKCEGDVAGSKISSDGDLSVDGLLAAFSERLSAKLDSVFSQQPENTVSLSQEIGGTQPDAKVAQCSVDENFLKEFRAKCEELERNPRPKEAPRDYINQCHIGETVAAISVFARKKAGPDLQVACGEICSYNLSWETRLRLEDLIGVILKPNRSSAYRQEMIVGRKVDLLTEAVYSFLRRSQSKSLEQACGDTARCSRPKSLTQTCEDITSVVRDMGDAVSRSSIKLSRIESSMEDIHKGLREIGENFRRENGLGYPNHPVHPEERKSANMEFIDGLVESLASHNPWNGL